MDNFIVMYFIFIKNNIYHFIQKNNRNNIPEEIDRAFILNKMSSAGG